jgi:DNA (cytosine-5)-methyltransferase 1
MSYLEGTSSGETSPKLVIRLRRKSGTPLSSGTVSPTQRPLRVSEFFCGIGGISIALKNNPQLSTVFVYDTEKYAKRIYDSNFFMPNMSCTDVSDLSVITMPQFDIMFCGLRALEEKNKQLIRRIIKTKAPCVICFETLKHYIKSEEYKIELEQPLKSLGYILTATTIDMSRITHIPQSKERGYIIATNNIHILTHFTFPSQRIAQLQPISEFLETLSYIHDKYYYQEGKSVYELLNENVTKPNTLYQLRRYYVRENKSDRCPTLTANMGRGGHNVPILRDVNGIRKLTPRECLNFQGFPKTFIIPPSIADSHLYTYIGEAPTVPIIQRLGEAIIQAIHTASLTPTSIS